MFDEFLLRFDAFKFCCGLLVLLLIEAIVSFYRVKHGKRPLLGKYSWKKKDFYFFIPLIALVGFVGGPYMVPSESMLPTVQVAPKFLVSKIAYGLRNPFTGEYIAKWDTPKRGDVFLFDAQYKGHNVVFIKRVIGEDGDLVFASPYFKNIFIVTKDGQVVSPNYLSNTDSPTSPELMALKNQGEEVEIFENFYHRIQDKRQVLPKDVSNNIETTLQEIGNFWKNGAEHVEYIKELEERYGLKMYHSNGYFAMGDNRLNSEDSRYIGSISFDRVVGKAKIREIPSVYGIPATTSNDTINTILKHLSVLY